MKRLFFMAFVLIILSMNTFGSEITNYSNLYENHSLKLQFDFWNGTTINRAIDNRTYNLSLLGIDRSLYNLLKDSPSSRTALNGYDNDMLLGHVFYWSGLTALVADLVLIFVKPDFVINSPYGMPTYFALLLGGTTSSFVGIGFYYSGYSKVYDAVWQYNKDLLNSGNRQLTVNDNSYNFTYSIKF